VVKRTEISIRIVRSWECAEINLDPINLEIRRLRQSLGRKCSNTIVLAGLLVLGHDIDVECGIRPFMQRILHCGIVWPAIWWFWSVALGPGNVVGACGAGEGEAEASLFVGGVEDADLFGDIGG
jgi:hypothetical protein